MPKNGIIEYGANKKKKKTGEKNKIPQKGDKQNID